MAPALAQNILKGRKNMKKRLLASVLAAVMMVTALTGCASQTAPTESPVQEAQATTEQKTEAPATEAPATAAPTEAPTTAAPTEAPATAEPTTEAEEELKALAAPAYMGGGLMPIEEAEVDTDDLSEDEQATMERAMRAYTPGKTLLVNNAKEFYYYNQMSKDSKALYDAMLLVAEDPTNPDNIVKAVISTDPNSDKFAEVFLTAYYGMLYDHAELFWLYNDIEAEMQVGLPYKDDAPKGKHSVYLMLEEPYANYKKEVNAFNDAAEAFLADIDRSASDAEIAKAIHDKLIDLVTYNTPVMEDNTESGFRNLAHTAYGALVADNKGTPNYAVCDGYSQAYVYLLQQCGINAAVIVGIAGSDQSTAGGHAWTVVQLDGDWYEVDSTWDDIGGIEEAIEGIKANDPFSYKYYHEAVVDPDYRDLVQHYLFNLTTKKITNFKADKTHNYISKDQKYTYSLIGDSVHIRAKSTMQGYGAYGYAVQLAPEAKGTQYAFR